jgi:hypothetical protein
VRALYEREPVASVFRASGVVSPSIYESIGVAPDVQSAYVASNVAEARRLASYGRSPDTPRAPVVPFGELYYHGAFGPNATSRSTLTLTSTERTSPSVVGVASPQDPPPICNVGPRPPLSNETAVLLDAEDIKLQTEMSTLSGADGVALWSGGSLPYVVSFPPVCRLPCCC